MNKNQRLQGKNRTLEDQNSLEVLSPSRPAFHFPLLGYKCLHTYYV